MGILSDIFTKFTGANEAFTELPWNKGESIYQWVKQRVDESSGALKKDVGDLPDEIPDDSGIKWAAGAMDGVMGHHSAHKGSSKLVSRFVGLTKKIATKNDEKALVDLYRLTVKEDMQSLIDDIIGGLIKANVQVEPHLLKRLALFLRRSPDRNPVKFAIALIGATKNSKYVDEIKLLGLHDEFTLYSAVAIENASTEPELDLWDLAQKVDGWGRIHVVERLSGTKNEQIADWIFHEGFRNEVMDEYLAYIAAETGALQERLDKGFIEKKTLLAAGDILSALINGGPAEDISHYQQSAVAINSYLRHSQLHMNDPDIKTFLTAHSIDTYLDDLDFNEEEWSKSLHVASKEMAEQIIAAPQWKPLVEQSLNTKSESEYYLFNQAAGLLEIDNWDINLRRLQDIPNDIGRWFQLSDLVNSHRVDAYIDLAKSLLNLKQIATGASNELGLGEDYKEHSCLDLVLQTLQDYPGKGWDLIKVGMFSPTVRCRHMAKQALESWPNAQLNDDIRMTINKAIEQEVDAEVEADLKAILRNQGGQR